MLPSSVPFCARGEILSGRCKVASFGAGKSCLGTDFQGSRTGASPIGSASCVNALTQLKLRCMSAFATRTLPATSRADHILDGFRRTSKGHKRANALQQSGPNPRKGIQGKDSRRSLFADHRELRLSSARPLRNREGALGHESCYQHHSHRD